jgi:hypothetical protein
MRSRGDALHRITVFPNPARDAWNIRFAEPPAENTAISVTDATGRIVRRHQASAGAIEVSIPAAGLPSGAYYYRFYAGGEAVSGILLKQ